ncbi:MauE/DoxX family redox-associated membrane protein [Evansella sp. AB-P1]|uniref:MauE/DoxX family redox-associated membrane protein n=1 Tax=Evansella sp. AB-P1 TaxID=3037653 RepID=UPI00241D4AF1|nr:MauE/DoxX family redox-associated membrane protein [Evansella sp. AB-P1]MDG5786178.1 MauE/DoxX family redox-associated membrane protein [Evansella sp. AB-P1]
MLTNLNSIIIAHVATFFFISGFMKVLSLKAFLQFVIEFKVLPKKLSILVGSLIPFLEIIASITFFFQQTWKFGIGLIFGLIIIFAYGVTQAIHSKRKIHCGCYGKWLNTEVDFFTLGKQMYLLLLALFITFSIPLHSVDHSILSIISGFLMTVIAMATHFIWHNYRKNVSYLRKTI